MMKTLAQKRYAYLFLALLALLLVGGGITYFWWPEKEITKNPTLDIETVHRTFNIEWLQAPENTNLVSLKPYSHTFGKQKEHATLVEGRWKKDENLIGMARKTTQKGKASEEDYFVLTNLVLEDAEALHKLISDSGEAYFGTEPMHQMYGQNLERAQIALMDTCLQHKLLYGIWHSKDKQHWKLIGYVGAKESPQRGYYKDWVELFYVVGNPTCTKVRGAATPAVHFLLEQMFLLPWKPFNPRIPGVFLTIHKQNTSSERVATKLSFTKEIGLEKNQASFTTMRRKDYRIWIKENKLEAS